MNRIIYKTADGKLAVIIPADGALDKFGIKAIALKDVPFGKPFKLCMDTDLPDRSQRDLWDIDDSELNDGVGGESNEFDKNQE